MRFQHISDTHGDIPRMYNNAHAVIHSGDFFPNSIEVRAFNYIKEKDFQRQWLKDNVESLKANLRDRAFLFTLGNHDFLSGEETSDILTRNGIENICLHDKVNYYAGFKFYGFPYIPAINGKWNFERTTDQMIIHANDLVERVNQDPVDFIVAHSPMHCLDYDSVFHVNFSNAAMANALLYRLNVLPKYYLHGHIHSAHGVCFKDNILFSNAATVSNVIEVL